MTTPATPMPAPATGPDGRGRDQAALVTPFPEPGNAVRLAYRELDLAEFGTPAQQHHVGDPRHLPRPWDPATCTDPRLRRELWTWLDGVVTWLNTEYTWAPSTAVATCWPAHPHLVHEIAVLADRRYRAGLATNAELLEDWHRYGLPSFLHRAATTSGSACETSHQSRPGRGQLAQHSSDEARTARAKWFDADLAATRRDPSSDGRYVTVDLDSGEAFEP